MNPTHLKLWELAKPYYEKGRVYDIPHIEWLMQEADRIADIENLDKKLLMPICILHDVGYSTVDEKNPYFKDMKIKLLHMQEGAKIAKQLLEEISYYPNLTEKIVYYISVHDNWVFGDSAPFKECKEMALFNDLDYVWGLSSFEMLKTAANAKKITPKEMFKIYSKDEKLVNRPFCCESTRKMFEEFVEQRKRELKKLTGHLKLYR